MVEITQDQKALIDTALAALQRGDGATAKDALERVLAHINNDVGLWLALSDACALLRDSSGQSAAVDAALQLNANDLRVLIAKADLLAEAGDLRGASAFYQSALRYAPQYKELPPHLQAGLRRAQAANQKLAQELEDFVRARMESAGFAQSDAPARLRGAVDLMFGKRRIYMQEPRYFYYPGLPQIEFYERSAFPWMDAIEAATDAIREELLAVRGPDFTPYVTPTPGRPQSAQAGMLNNPDWGAYFLCKNGEAQVGAEKCPQVMATLREAPLTRIPGRTPSVLFSKLAAGAHIPPHNGMLNARLICHLPLIVPERCAFRVGNETRAWTEGKAWAFDDSIEHEAWNKSAADRYILLFDIWRPELSEEECAGIAALCSAVDAFGGARAAAWDN